MESNYFLFNLNLLFYLYFLFLYNFLLVKLLITFLGVSLAPIEMNYLIYDILHPINYKSIPFNNKRFCNIILKKKFKYNELCYF